MWYFAAAREKEPVLPGIYRFGVRGYRQTPDCCWQSAPTLHQSAWPKRSLDAGGDTWFHVCEGEILVQTCADVLLFLFINRGRWELNTTLSEDMKKLKHTWRKERVGFIAHGFCFPLCASSGSARKVTLSSLPRDVGLCYAAAGDTIAGIRRGLLLVRPA